MPQAFTSGGTGGGGSGTVKSVTAADTSVVVAGTATDPTVATGTLDVIAADHPPAANWSNNAKKITALANGTAASDAAAFGQIPAALPPNGAAGGDLSGTYPNPAVKAITETSGPTDLVIGTVTDGQFLKRVGGTLVSAAGGTGTVTSVTAADGSVVVAGTAAAPTIATGTLDVIAAQHAPAADWSNNSHKITSVSNGTLAQDAAAFGQLVSLLARQIYAPGTRTLTGVTGATLAAFDATNLTITFTAPLSGNVLVRFVGMLSSGTAAALSNIGLFLHGSTTVVGNIWAVRPNTVTLAGSVTSLDFVVTGLTPGNSIQYDLMGATTAGNAVNVVSYGFTTSDTATGIGGPTILEVWRL